LNKEDQVPLTISDCLPKHKELVLRPLLNRGGRQKAKDAICNLLSKQSTMGTSRMANMQHLNVGEVSMDDLYTHYREFTPKDLNTEIGNAKIKTKAGRTRTEHALLKAQVEVKQFVKDVHDAKVASYVSCDDPRIRDIYNDFNNLSSLVGKTYDHHRNSYVTMTVLKTWLETNMHLRKALCISSPAGRGKTPFSYSLAKEFALRYQRGSGPSYKPYFVTASTVEGLKQVIKAGLLVEGTPVVLEDFVPTSPAGSEKQDYMEFLVNLFEVLNVSTVAARNEAMNMPAKCIIIMTTNRSEDQWLRIHDEEMKKAIWKRLLFVTLPEGSLIKQSAINAGELDLDQEYREGLERKRRRIAGHTD